jgi:WD40 repeat protein
MSSIQADEIIICTALDRVRHFVHWCIHCLLSTARVFNLQRLASAVRSVSMASGANLQSQAVLCAANRVAGCASASLGSHDWTLRLAPVAAAVASDTILGGSGSDASSSATCGLVAIGSGRYVGLYDPIGCRYLGMLAGHEGRVNSIAWIHKPQIEGGSCRYGDETELVSCGSDGAVRVWRFEHGWKMLDGRSIGSVSWECTAHFQTTKSSATAVAAFAFADGAVVIASTAADCALRVWFRTARSNSWACAESFLARSTAVMECVAISLLPGFEDAPAEADLSNRGVLLATGAVDNKINLFTIASASSGLVITPLLSLSGHMDWIRGLSFSLHTQLSHHFGEMVCRNSHGSSLFLASASQDAKVRLWKLSALPPAELVVEHLQEASEEFAPDSEDDEVAPVSVTGVGSLLVNVAHAHDLLSLNNPLLAALQRPRKFSVLVLGRTYAYEVIFDAMLSGHDAWVNTVQWHPPVRVGAYQLWQPPCIITASMDKSIIFWQPSGGAGSEESVISGGVWEPAVRVGSAGAAVAGLYGAQLSCDGSVVLAHGYQGALHVWSCEHLRSLQTNRLTRERCVSNVFEFSLTSDGRTRLWEPRPAELGHFGPVTCVQWDPEGLYLMSSSLDFTTRVWAPVVNRNCKDYRWFEIGRPQIHGYETQCVVLPPLFGLRHRLLSAADEKVIRVFDAPLLFLRALRQLSAFALYTSGFIKAPDGPFDACEMPRPEFSYVPELGLTNKPVTAEGAGAPIKDRFQMDGRDAEQRAADTKAAALRKATMAVIECAVDDATGDGAQTVDDDPDRTTLNRMKTLTLAAKNAQRKASEVPSTVCDTPPTETVFAHGMISSAGPHTTYEFVSSDIPPPLEEDLVQHSRWSETNKLFGHVNEVFCLAVNSSGTLLASACKARNEVHAAIRIWDAVSGRLLQVLPAHKLTVISLSFSPARSCLSRYCEDTGATLWTQQPLQRFPSKLEDESEFLVSVSKDRSVGIFGLSSAQPVDVSSAAPSAGYASGLPAQLQAAYGTPRAHYKLLTIIESAHKRVIWSVSWCNIPSLAPLLSHGVNDAVDPSVSLFATGARDQMVKLWYLSRRPATTVARRTVAAHTEKDITTDDEDTAGFDVSNERALVAADAAEVAASNRLAVSVGATSGLLAAAVTAVAFAPVTRVSGDDAVSIASILCAGLENGAVRLFQCCGLRTSADTGVWNWSMCPLMDVDPAISHVSTVRSISWRPLPLFPRKDAAEQAKRLQFASSSTDETIRIFEVQNE